MAHLEESGRLVDAETGDTWRIGKKGLVFGKGAIEIQGAGLGGTAALNGMVRRMRWRRQVGCSSP